MLELEGEDVFQALKAMEFVFPVGWKKGTGLLVQFKEVLFSGKLETISAFWLAWWAVGKETVYMIPDLVPLCRRSPSHIWSFPYQGALRVALGGTWNLKHGKGKELLLKSPSNLENYYVSSLWENLTPYFSFLFIPFFLKIIHILFLISLGVQKESKGVTSSAQAGQKPCQSSFTELIDISLGNHLAWRNLSPKQGTFVYSSNLRIKKRMVLIEGAEEITWK